MVYSSAKARYKSTCCLCLQIKCANVRVDGLIITKPVLNRVIEMPARLQLTKFSRECLNPWYLLLFSRLLLQHQKWIIFCVTVNHALYRREPQTWLFLVETSPAENLLAIVWFRVCSCVLAAIFCHQIICSRKNFTLKHYVVLDDPAVPRAAYRVWMLVWGST